jgi:hypothetical protein
MGENFQRNNKSCWPFSSNFSHHNCMSCWELSKDMWYATYKHLFQGDSWLLMGKSQIDTLTLGLSNGHNLCLKYSNGSCKPILECKFQDLSNGIWNSLI